MKAKITITMTLKSTNKVVSTIEETIDSMTKALKLITEIDKEMLKRHHKFTYKIEEVEE